MPSTRESPAGMSSCVARTRTFIVSSVLYFEEEALVDECLLERDPFKPAETGPQPALASVEACLALSEVDERSDDMASVIFAMKSMFTSSIAMYGIGTIVRSGTSRLMVVEPPPGRVV